MFSFEQSRLNVNTVRFSGFNRTGSHDHSERNFHTAFEADQQELEDLQLVLKMPLAEGNSL